MEALKLAKKHESIAIYCRVSSDKQNKDGTIESQLASVSEYCAKAGYEIDVDQIFKDEGYSGSTLERPGLDNLRDKANHGLIDKVVILDPDRLARKSTHQLLLSEELKKLGVTLEFVNRQLGDNPEDRLLFNMQGIIAEFEREKIIERTRRGKIYKAKNGQISVMSRSPYGYQYIKKQECKDARYEIIPEEAGVVKDIFELFTEKDFSIRGVVNELYSRGTPSHTGNKNWSTTAVWELLSNPVYSGKAAYGKRKAVERKKATKRARNGTFYPKTPHSSHTKTKESSWIYLDAPQIISPEIFQRAKQKLEENKRFSPRNRKTNRYLLSGLIRCEICDYAIIGSCSHRPPGKDHFYYRCQGIDASRFIDKKKVCTGRPIRCEVLDELVWEQIKKLLKEPELVLNEFNSRIAMQNKSSSTLDNAISQQQKLVSQYQQERARLIKLYQNGTVDLQEIQLNLEQIRNKIKKAQSEINLLDAEKKQKDQFLILVNKLGDFTKNLNSNLNSLNFEQKQKIVRLLTDDIVVNTITGTIKVRHVVPQGDCCRLRPGSLSDSSAPVQRHKFGSITKQYLT